MKTVEVDVLRVLDLQLQLQDGGVRRDLQGDRLARDGLHEDLHGILVAFVKHLDRGFVVHHVGVHVGDALLTNPTAHAKWLHPGFALVDRTSTLGALLDQNLVLLALLLVLDALVDHVAGLALLVLDAGGCLINNIYHTNHYHNKYVE